MLSNPNFILKTASAKILWECVDTSTLVINLENGSYYSLEQSASILWKLLLAGYSPNQIAEQASIKYDLDRQSTLGEILQWCESLILEGLMISDSQQSGASLTLAELVLTEYVKPELKKYTDLETLLLADPIHEFQSRD